jgi:hypothetical protein
MNRIVIAQELIRLARELVGVKVTENEKRMILDKFGRIDWRVAGKTIKQLKDMLSRDYSFVDDDAVRKAGLGSGIDEWIEKIIETANERVVNKAIEQPDKAVIEAYREWDSWGDIRLFRKMLSGRILLAALDIFDNDAKKLE